MPHFSRITRKKNHERRSGFRIFDSTFADARTCHHNNSLEPHSSRGSRLETAFMFAIIIGVLAISIWAVAKHGKGSEKQALPPSAAASVLR